MKITQQDLEDLTKVSSYRPPGKGISAILFCCSGMALILLTLDLRVDNLKSALVSMTMFCVLLSAALVTVVMNRYAGQTKILAGILEKMTKNEDDSSKSS